MGSRWLHRRKDTISRLHHRFAAGLRSPRLAQCQLENLGCLAKELAFGGWVRNPKSEMPQNVYLVPFWVP